MQRYFVKGNLDNILFNEQDIFHIQKVMRCKKGDQIEIVLDEKAYLTIIDEVNPLRIHIQEPINNEVELSYPTTLFFPLTKSDKIELVIQKGTELGISRIILYRASRSVVKMTNEDFKRKENRMISIAKEASEQCHRLKIPEIIGVVDFKDIKNYEADHNLFAYELEAGKVNPLEKQLNNIKGSVNMIVGPEGGFTKEEAEYLVNNKYVALPLGKRILRCETAAIYLMTLVSYYLEK